MISELRRQQSILDCAKMHNIPPSSLRERLAFIGMATTAEPAPSLETAKFSKIYKSLPITADF